MMRKTVLGIGVLLLLLGTSAQAQQILIDQGARLGGLWVFPSANDPNAYYYVPQTARLSLDERGRPIFSFLRYVQNRASDPSSSEGIIDAGGGGIVTLMATYDTPEETLRTAQRALRRQTERDEAVLQGPVIFKSGRYVLVSSILQETGEEGKMVLTTGNAPVFEGNEVAFSFDVSPQQSKLLLESFQMATPDVSLVFEMTVTGLSDAYDAMLTVNWSEIEKSGVFKGGASALGGFLAGDIEKGFDELQKSQAIQLVTRGSNKNMEALVDKVHEKLLNIMFTSMEPEKIETQAKKDNDDPLGGIMDIFGGIGEMFSQPGALTRAISPIGFSVEYEAKEFRREGRTTLHFNNQAPADRVIMIAANIGDLFSRFGDDERMFRTVNLSDPAYQQREVHVGIDGAILPEFAKYINSVTVTLRKQHENGAETLQEIVVDAGTFDLESRDFRMIYGWNGDTDRDRWIEYDYRTRWSFKDGGLLETDWTRTENNMIDLYAPYRRNTVELIGDAEALRAEGVRAVAVEVEYDFFSGRRTRELALTTREQIDGKEIEITLPLNVYEYDYKITWLRRGAEPIVSKGRDDTGVIFVDDIPEPAPDSTEAGT